MNMISAHVDIDSRLREKILNLHRWAEKQVLAVSASPPQAIGLYANS
jgi:hypothetical protein